MGVLGFTKFSAIGRSSCTARSHSRSNVRFRESKVLSRLADLGVWNRPYAVVKRIKIGWVWWPFLRCDEFRIMKMSVLPLAHIPPHTMRDTGFCLCSMAHDGPGASFDHFLLFCRLWTCSTIKSFSSEKTIFFQPWPKAKSSATFGAVQACFRLLAINLFCAYKAWV